MKPTKDMEASNPCNSSYTAKVIHIEDYREKRQALEEQRRARLESSLEKEGLEEEEREKTLDLFLRVLNTMRKESY